MIAADAASGRLARLALDAGDIDQARWATRRGLEANPGALPLLELRLDIAAAAGSLTEADAIMDEARAVYAEDDGPEFTDTILVDLATTYNRVRAALAA